MSKRFEALASLVDTKKVYDVGCDHGLLSIMLAKNHDVCASDITDTSVATAIKNIKAANLNIPVIKSDGLDNLDIDANSTLILAGMGCFTILKILNKNINKVPNTLVIQSNNNLDILRRSIVKLGYFIDAEINLYEKRWYTLIRFKKGYRKYSRLDYILGINPSKEYLEFLLRIYTKMYKEIPLKCIFRKIKIHHLINKIKKV